METQVDKDDQFDDEMRYALIYRAFQISTFLLDTKWVIGVFLIVAESQKPLIYPKLFSLATLNRLAIRSDMFQDPFRVHQANSLNIQERLA